MLPWVHTSRQKGTNLVHEFVCMLELLSACCSAHKQPQSMCGCCLSASLHYTHVCQSVSLSSSPSWCQPTFTSLSGCLSFLLGAVLVQDDQQGLYLLRFQFEPSTARLQAKLQTLYSATWFLWWPVPLLSSVEPVPKEDGDRAFLALTLSDGFPPPPPPPLSVLSVNHFLIF